MHLSCHRHIAHAPFTARSHFTNQFTTSPKVFLTHYNRHLHAHTHIPPPCHYTQPYTILTLSPFHRSLHHQSLLLTIPPPKRVQRQPQSPQEFTAQLPPIVKPAQPVLEEPPSLLERARQKVKSGYKRQLHEIDTTSAQFKPHRRCDMLLSLSLLLVVITVNNVVYVLYVYGKNQKITAWIDANMVLTLQNIQSHRYYTAFTYVFAHRTFDQYVVNTVAFAMLSTLIIPHMTFRQYRTALLYCWLAPCVVSLMTAYVKLQRISRDSSGVQHDLTVKHTGMSGVVSGMVAINALVRKTLWSILLAGILIEHTGSQIYYQNTDSSTINHRGHAVGLCAGICHYLVSLRGKAPSAVYTSRALYMLTLPSILVGSGVLAYYIAYKPYTGKQLTLAAK